MNDQSRFRNVVTWFKRFGSIKNRTLSEFGDAPRSRCMFQKDPEIAG